MMLMSYFFAFALVAAFASEPDSCGASQGCDSDVALSEVQMLQSDVRVNKAGSTAIRIETRMAKSAASAIVAFANGTAAETTTTPDPTGMTMNAEGDLIAFISALVLNVATIFVFFVAVHILRRKYPQVYADNVKQGFAPSEPDSGFWGWARASLNLTLDEAIHSVGLDQALMLEFTHLCMKILACIGVPMFFIMGPINCAFGGNAAGEDHLSYLSFGNVQNGSNLYWIHALLVWGVVFVVQTSVYNAQKRFLKLRFAWLAGLPAIRSNTLLVEGIPEECRSDDKLKAFFERMIPGSKVKDAYVAKDTTDLEALVAAEQSATAALKMAEYKWKKAGAREDDKPTVRLTYLGAKVDAIEHYNYELVKLKAQIKNERARIMELAPIVGGVNLGNGFVTFEKRYDAEICHDLNLTPDNDEWVLSTPPPPSSVLWSDLTQDPLGQSTRTLIGYALVGGLYFAYMPLVIGITNIAKLINLGALQPVWAGLAPTMGLQFMVAFLPTFLLLIFRLFFTLKADAFAQHKLQVWYFWFQIVFVILATAVGQDVKNFTNTLATDPFAIFGVMANTMPYATHFYMNFLVLQWVTHCTNLVRMVPLMKFKFFSAIYDEAEAKEMSEPEDQDYYGIGSRSARWTINMAVGIVYGTLSPPINVLAFANFLITRLVYGYLLPFAETKKPDLGGVFWVSMLKGLFVANVVYCVLMIGVLTERAANWGPMIIATPSLFYVLWSMNRFNTQFAWHRLPHTYVIEEITKPTKKREAIGRYVQPVLLPELKQ